MRKLIKDGAIVDDQWQLIAKPEAAPESLALPSGNILVPLQVWLAQKNVLKNRTDVGVWLDSDEEAQAIADDIQGFAVIALNFPLFMDGRAFSTARLLRERYAFKGELRAIGNFIRDQLCYLRRCGVNAFSFANEQTNLQAALKSLQDFTEYYQSSVDQPLPLFRRRA